MHNNVWSEIAQICQAFFKEEDPQKLLKAVIDKSLGLLRAERASVFLAPPVESFDEDESSVLRSVLAGGLEDQKIVVDIENSLVGACFQSQEAFTIREARKDSRFNSDIDEKTGYQTQSVLCVPLGGKAGVLQVLNSFKGEFDQSEIEKAKILAFFASAALEQLNKIDELNALAEGLTSYQNQTIQRPVHALRSEYPQLQEVIQKLPHIAQSDANVLIVGKTGTGKEDMVRHVHASSHRSEQPCIVLNCAYLNENNLEEELLGVRHGGEGIPFFVKKGKVHLADRGSLVLHRLEELSLDAQAILLRVLKEVKLESKHVGAGKRDFRLLCTSGIDLKEKVEEGVFREDLFYWINVVSITLPDLAQRKNDIPYLIQEIFEDLNQYQPEHSKKTMGNECENYLVNKDWPGNLRQLRNAIEGAFLVSASRNQLSAQDFSGSANSNIVSIQGRRGAKSPLNCVMEMGNFKEAKREFEQIYIDSALRKHGGNKSQTAKSIGLSREALRKILMQKGGAEKKAA